MVIKKPKWINILHFDSMGDLSGRMWRHNSSHKGFTSTGKPWELKYSEPFTEKTMASRREMELKSWKNRKKIESLIQKNQSN